MARPAFAATTEKASHPIAPCVGTLELYGESDGRILIYDRVDLAWNRPMWPRPAFAARPRRGFKQARPAWHANICGRNTQNDRVDLESGIVVMIGHGQHLAPAHGEGLRALRGYALELYERVGRRGILIYDRVDLASGIVVIIGWPAFAASLRETFHPALVGTLWNSTNESDAAAYSRTELIL